MATYDALTDLPNRILLMDRLSQLLASSRRRGDSAATLFIDIDRFKGINDSLGHPVGDALLQAVARRIKESIRAEDTAARLGGDEFVILLPALSDDPEEAAQLAQMWAEKIKRRLSHAYMIDNHELHVTASIGIALLPMGDEIADDILMHADTAMYRAKESGRNTTRFFIPSMQLAAEERLRLQNDMRRALHHGEFQLHYQPKVDSAGKIVGAEALLRWRHASNGMVMPSDFIPVAEETGQILDIGDWVLVNALSQLRQWESARAAALGANLSINVSPRQFRRPDFAFYIERLLRDSGVNPGHLTLELTEGVLVENMQYTLDKMNALRGLGIRFSIDDFGTGYSSLAYLKRLPVDELKIDKDFIRDVASDPNDANLVETIITMAGNFGLEVVAEGVETREQFDFLLNRGCACFQGNYFSEPKPVEELTDLIH
ncbi:MAG: hypothetical protein C3L25_11810 [Candidatus Sedimenticola endophacoides]|uniref:Diguanylate cyclase n=1 Tax=Candidatus Sedimenticola endophacoides TaxID=2548426 RepID=A0A6N4E9J3_9GAMM|nr:MAG: hypothetical protein B0D94_01085 [Candidatus Sedimenticola endophacoides]OQX42518.1 MAG: hypothetical protein B0D89_01120 [Candidatus Sedimenticola endophacoides]OQX49025.1 MAG: hypothetical protein B0D87_02600 [Candidatus Sedimenticola endophacoides]PUD98610.1 MAG: hypothetical protein C3L26_11905 [Candidatus Sedimenticola endophacoides]PUE01772.1 MAG: hypothetical protein C3L25_11810 [Candidatus Sedimenticola endophacoides]